MTSPGDRSTPTVAIILAGGLGTRMGGLAEDSPKHLLEVAGEPVIVHQLRWLAAHGVDDIILATAHLAERFEPVLGNGRQWGVRLRYSTEPRPAGTAGALRIASKVLPNLPDHLVVLNGDLLTDHDLSRQLALARQRPSCRAVLHLRTVDDPRQFGCVVADELGRVTAFVEKSPTPASQEVNAGTYVLHGSVVESLPSGTLSLERDVLPELVRQGDVTAYREQATWADIGTPTALVEASRHLVERSGRENHVDPTSTVHPTARVSGGSAIGPGAIIERDAVVVGSVVMRGARVGSGSRMENAALAPGQALSPGSVFGP